MIAFIISIAMVTSLFAVFSLFIKKKVVTGYRGGFFIVLSAFYFSILFWIAHLMRENFK